jgi:hypothetical protein
VSIFRYADRTVTFAQAMPPNKTPVNMNVKINFSLDDDLLGEETKRVVRRKTRYYRKSQEGL